MAEPSESGTRPERHQDSLGVQAYRWLTLIGMLILTALSGRVLLQVDKTSDKVEALQLQVTSVTSTMNSRIDAHVQRLDTSDRRNDNQDAKIDDLQRRVWSRPETRIP